MNPKPGVREAEWNPVLHKCDYLLQCPAWRITQAGKNPSGSLWNVLVQGVNTPPILWFANVNTVKKKKNAIHISSGSTRMLVTELVFTVAGKL